MNWHQFFQLGPKDEMLCALILDSDSVRQTLSTWESNDLDQTTIRNIECSAPRWIASETYEVAHLELLPLSAHLDRWVFTVRFNQSQAHKTSTDPHHDISEQTHWHHPGCASVRWRLLDFMSTSSPPLPPPLRRLLYCDHLRRAYLQIAQWHFALSSSRPPPPVSMQGTSSGAFQFTSGSLAASILTVFLTYLLTFCWTVFLASILKFFLLVEARQRTLRADDQGWGPARNTGSRGSRLTRRRRRRTRRRRRRRRRRWSDKISNNPHLTGGESQYITHNKMRKNTKNTLLVG